MLNVLGNRHTKKSTVYLEEQQRNVSGEPEADNLRSRQKKFSGHESKFIF